MPFPVGAAGVGTTDHVDPFHCCINGPLWLPVSPVVAPAAQQSSALTHMTLETQPPSGGEAAKLGTIVQLAPSQCSMIPWSPIAPGKMGRKLGFS
jgi:hypothetical protein